MPFLLVLGAAYGLAKLTSNKNKDNNKCVDVRLKSDNTTAEIESYEKPIFVSLLPNEQKLSIYELPIATITVYRGNYEVAIPILQSRIREILHSNPWLTGHLVMTKSAAGKAAEQGNGNQSKIVLNGQTNETILNNTTQSVDVDSDVELCLVYNDVNTGRASVEADEVLLHKHFQVFDSDKELMTNVNPSVTPHHDLGKVFSSNTNDVVVGENFELINDTTRPLWKVSIVPICKVMDPNAGNTTIVNGDHGSTSLSNIHDNQFNENEKRMNAIINSSEFMIVVSMSHVLGDAYTYYKIFKMLDSSNEIEALNPIRREPSYTKAVIAKLGLEQASFVQNMVDTTKADCKKTIDDKAMSKMVDSKQIESDFLKSLSSSQLASRIFTKPDFTYSDEYVANNNNLHNNDAVPPISNVPHIQNTDRTMVTKLFFIDEEWIIQQRQQPYHSIDGSRKDSQQQEIMEEKNNTAYHEVEVSINTRRSLRGSTLYDPDDLSESVEVFEDSYHTEASLISDNDITDLSNEYNDAKINSCSNDNVVAVNQLETKTENVTVSYNKAISNCPLSTTLKDLTMSANSILTSWFFSINNASVGLCMVNLRNRLFQYGCNVNNLDAGNYVNAMVFHPHEYSTPEHIQSFTDAFLSKNSTTKNTDGNTQPAVVTTTTTATANQNNNNNEAAQLLVSPQSTSMSVNWANFYCEENKIHPKITQIIHVPLYSTSVLSNRLPDRISSINIFTASNSTSTDTLDSNNKTNDGQVITDSYNNRRLGAFVLCKEYVWNECIRNCGIVKEMIAAS